MSPRTFLGASALLFTASAALTIHLSTSMSSMPDASVRHAAIATDDSICGEDASGRGWMRVSSSFQATWTVMMVAMMLPALVPVLRQYRKNAFHPSAKRVDALTAMAGAGYFSVWTAIGLALEPLRAALASSEMLQPALARANPAAAGAVVLLAGAYQWSGVKARHLACCRQAATAGRPSVGASPGGAWRDGVRLGLECARCCGNLMAILLALGMMDLRVMAAITAAITAERLAPSGRRTARAIGAITVAVGVLVLARAIAPA